jgi:hypothetical protein
MISVYADGKGKEKDIRNFLSIVEVLSGWKQEAPDSCWKLRIGPGGSNSSPRKGRAQVLKKRFHKQTKKASS